MKKLLKLSFLLLMLSSLGKKNQGVVSSNIICIDSTCSCYNLVHSTNEVKSEITFSIDASSAMGNTSNINEAMLWLINNIFQNVSISENSAGIAIQKAGINFVNTEMYYYINDACVKIRDDFIVQKSRLFSNISIYKILGNYLQNSKQYGRTGYPQTFVMITAATDDSILNAVEIANDIKQSGTKILVVALNQTDLSFNNSFYAISENVRLYEGFKLPKTDLPKWILDLANSSTVTPIALKPFVRPDAAKLLSEATGTPCSNNLYPSDMNVNIVVDKTISSNDLADLGTYLAEVLSGLHLDGSSKNSSCVGINAYGPNGVTELHSISNCTAYIDKNESGDDLFNTCINLADMHQDDDGTHSDLYKALNSSILLFKEKASLKKFQLLLVASRDFKSVDTEAIKSLADQLKKMKVFIVTVDYSDKRKQTSDKYDKDSRIFHRSNYSDRAAIIDTTTSNGQLMQYICSGEQAFNKSEAELDTLITNTFAYINCECPKNLIQMTLVDPKTRHTALFADCIYAVSSPSTAYSAEKQCEALGGSLLSFTSKSKFDFVQNEVVMKKLSGVKNYWTGLHYRSTDQTLNWYYHDHLNLPVGSSNSLVPNVSTVNATDYCGQVSFEQSKNTSAIIEFASCNTLLPFICQIHAFDADHRRF